MTFNPVMTLVDSTGTPTQSTPVTLISLPSAARTTPNTGTLFSTASVNYLAVDVTITAFTGGSAPTITFFVNRIGSDGVSYNVWTGAAKNSAGAFSVDLGPGFATAADPNGSQHAVFTAQATFGWTISGNPTSVTFSASVVGRT